MTEYKTITVKVLAVARIPSKSDSYAEMEKLDVVDTNQQQFKLTRFRSGNENKIAEGYWYRGKQKPAKSAEYNDTFMMVEYVGNTPDDVENPFDWPEVNGKELDARQKSILVQSDMKTAAMLCQAFGFTTEGEFEMTYKYVKKFREEEEKK